ncbi:hypothetical protein [Sorangium sp. So ce341]|uniref:hypothetical protein n=1 Tax=Sorangium sp. So ce341 TaxID=3133302 RepID=UPI003F5DAE77
MMTLIIPPAQINVFSVPEINLHSGQLVEVRLPFNWTDDDANNLFSLLRVSAEGAGIRMALANTLQSRPLSWIDRLWRRSADAVVASAAGCSVGEARTLCARCGVEAGQSIATLPWTDRKLLDLELAGNADVIVVDDIGLDPIGEKRVLGRIEAMLAARRLGVFALRFPLVTYSGESKEPRYSPSWSPHVAVIASVRDDRR